MKAIAIVAVGCAIVGAASAMAALEENDVFNNALLATLETDEALTAQYNAESAEAHSLDRRMAQPAAPAADCCYSKGYWYKSGYWYGDCYCCNGQWTCKKPQPPAPKCCKWNGKYYATGQSTYLTRDYACQCKDGNWGNCYYYRAPAQHKPQHKPMPIVF